MKKIGIVRHIDDVGRIVIPREIRKKFNIQEDDELEILTDNKGNIILKKVEVR